MNDNDIEKALRYLGCHMKYMGESDASTVLQAVSLITRQKAEIEALKLINSTYVATTNEIREIAIKEFAERLREKALPDDSIGCDMIVYLEDINDLVKVMVGEWE